MDTEVNTENTKPPLCCCDADIDDCDWYDFFQVKDEKCPTKSLSVNSDNQINFSEVNNDGCGKQS